jgi:hypothetical protein
MTLHIKFWQQNYVDCIKDLKTLRARDLMFLRLTWGPLCHAARVLGWLFTVGIQTYLVTLLGKIWVRIFSWHTINGLCQSQQKSKPADICFFYFALFLAAKTRETRWPDFWKLRTKCLWNQQLQHQRCSRLERFSKPVFNKLKSLTQFLI